MQWLRDGGASIGVCNVHVIPRRAGEVMWVIMTAACILVWMDRVYLNIC
jgi:hypothetical protein